MSRTTKRTLRRQTVDAVTDMLLGGCTKCQHPIDSHNLIDRYPPREGVKPQYWCCEDECVCKIAKNR